MNELSMKKKTYKLFKSQEGLTLIELLAVIVILAIIAAIAIPSILNLTTNTRKDAVIAAYKSMKEGANLLIAQEGFENLSGSNYDTLLVYDGENAPAAAAINTNPGIIVLTLGTLINEGLIDRYPQVWDNSSTNYLGTDLVIMIDRRSGSALYYALAINHAQTKAIPADNGAVAADWVLLDSLARTNIATKVAPLP